MKRFPFLILVCCLSLLLIAPSWAGELPATVSGRAEDKNDNEVGDAAVEGIARVGDGKDDHEYRAIFEWDLTAVLRDVVDAKKITLRIKVESVVGEPVPIEVHHKLVSNKELSQTDYQVKSVSIIAESMSPEEGTWIELDVTQQVQTDAQTERSDGRFYTGFRLQAADPKAAPDGDGQGDNYKLTGAVLELHESD